jgi:hypothetical protein
LLNDKNVVQKGLLGKEMTKPEAIGHLEALIESLASSEERERNLKKDLREAFETRGEVIAKYVFYELSLDGRRPSRTQSELIKDIGYYFA